MQDNGGNVNEVETGDAGVDGFQSRSTGSCFSGENILRKSASVHFEFRDLFAV